MYNGEIAIPRDDIDNFLAVAEQFKIRGLYNDRPAPPQRQPPPIQQQHHQPAFRRPSANHGRQSQPRQQQPLVPPDIRKVLILLFK